MDFIDESEKAVYEFFDSRPGWSINKLDFGGIRSADYLITGPTYSFLCEIKTVYSVHANYSYSALDVHLQGQERQLNDIELWKSENPNSRLILTKDQFDYLYQNDTEFRARYRHTQRNTESVFDKSAISIQEAIANSPIGNMPFRLRIDSPDFYAPKPKERKIFIQWIIAEVESIASGRVGRGWTVTEVAGLDDYFTYFYEIHTPIHKNDLRSQYQITLSRNLNSSELEISIFGYGDWNFAKFDEVIAVGVDQLEKSATREGAIDSPQAIVLSLQVFLGFDRPRLESHLISLMESYPALSAIALLGNDLNGSTTFGVLHNPNAKGGMKLPSDAFFVGKFNE